MPKEEIAENQGGGFKKVLVSLLTYLIILGLGAGGVYYLAKTKPGLIGLPKSQTENQAEADALVSQVGKLITLPADEKPTVATITNIDQLKDQPFFRNAKNGDRILVYQNANKAIIFRPSENRIIDVGTVNVTNPSPTVSPTATPKGQKAIPTPTEKPSPEPTATP